MKYLLSFIKAHKKLFLMLFTVTLINVARMIVFNAAFSGIINASISFSKKGIFESSAVSALVSVLAIPFIMASGYLTVRFAEVTGHEARMKMAEHLMKADLGIAVPISGGDVLSRVNNDLNNVLEYLRNDMTGAIGDLLLFVAAAIYLSFTNLFLTILAYGAVILSFFISNITSKPVKAWRKKRQEALAGVSSVLKAAAEALPVLKIYSMEGILATKHDRYVREAMAYDRKAENLATVLSTTAGFFCVTPLFVILGAGGYLVYKRIISPGELYRFFIMSSFLTGILNGFPTRITSFKGLESNSERVFEMFSVKLEEEREPVRITSQESRIPGTLKTGMHIEFKDVWFSYNNEKDVLKGISFELPAGQRTALVGDSGCGKSTILKLLCGFYRPNSGSILINGERIESMGFEKLRSQLAVVTQETCLFPGSFLENITCGHDITQEKVVEACKAANLYDFINSLPSGLDTEIGENGAGLSGGQRQRVAIARAFVKNAPVLLLDEATAGLDYKTEDKILSAMERLMKGRTVLMVTHRLTSIRDNDLVLYLYNGRIAEKGTKAELLEKKGFFHALYTLNGKYAKDWSEQYGS